MLPFIAGAVLGAVAVVAVQNRKKIAEKITDTAENVKENIVDAKNSVKEKIEDMTSKEEAKVVEGEK